ncbi:MAG: ankyrin repeat domain-containing protein, partial [Gemmatimonadetes bacterium]|nr:ankyrin repeat domain-containing protein [Gemmatimonadota bacterium]
MRRLGDFWAGWRSGARSSTGGSQSFRADRFGVESDLRSVLVFVGLVLWPGDDGFVDRFRVESVTESVVTAPDPRIVDAAKRDDIEAVRALLLDGADVNEAHGDGMTGLHWAALNGNAAIARLLIDAGATLEAVTRLGAHTPLHVAAKEGRGEVVAILVEAGADPAAATETGATPLHFAAASGDVRAVTVLLHHGAAADAREPQWGQTPLMFAAALGRTEAVAALLGAGADGTATAHVMDLVERDIADRASQRQRSREVAALREGRELPPDPPPPPA